MKSYKHLYSLTFKDKPQDYLHFAAHSHHPWPDCTYEAHAQYWRDSAKYLDNKWDYIFTKIIPDTQKNIASILNLSLPDMISIAPNTHEFVARLFSCFEIANGSKVKILTTDSEFHSFRRQLFRLLETPNFSADIVPVEPYDTFQKRWCEKLIDNQYNMIFTSHVFFNSGLMCPSFESWIPKVSKDTMIVVDGYHAFCAFPIDLKAYENKIFYIAGGYKYAQGGEGICFMSVPSNSSYRPANTGWFASFETLNQAESINVSYSSSGMRFAGSTFDPSGCYRFNAVVKTLRNEDLSIQTIHERIQDLKKYFIEKFASLNIPNLDRKNLIEEGGTVGSAHFLTFRIPEANEIEKVLLDNNIIVDSRGDRLRFGLGLYHDKDDINNLVEKLKYIKIK